MDERKFDELIDLLKFIVAVDSGISAQNSEIIKDWLDVLKGGESDEK